MPRENSRSGTINAINNMYHKSAPILVAEALLLGICAILMVFRPVAFLSIMTVIIGIGLIIFGLYRTIAGFATARNFGGGVMDVLFGIINVLIGVIFCVYPTGSMIGVVYIFVILFGVKAFQALIFAINMVRIKFGHYVFNLVMAIALVGLAVLLLVYPVVAPVMVVYYLALTLLTYAISDIYMFIELIRLGRSMDE